MKFRDKELDDDVIEYISHLLDMARAEIVKEIMTKLNLSQADACSLEWRLMLQSNDCETLGWIA